MLAAKCALAIRVDALGDAQDASIGIDSRAKVEARMRQLEGKVLSTEGAKPKGKEQPAKYDKSKQAGAAAPALATQAKAYNADADVATESKEEKKKARTFAFPCAARILPENDVHSFCCVAQKKKKREEAEEAEAPAPAEAEKKKKKKKEGGAAEEAAEEAGDAKVRIVLGAAGSSMTCFMLARQVQRVTD